VTAYATAPGHSGGTMLVYDTATNCSLLQAMQYTAPERREELYMTDGGRYFLHRSTVHNTGISYYRSEIRPLESIEAMVWFVGNLGTYSLAPALKSNQVWPWTFG
jgi:hypothetical protein